MFRTNETHRQHSLFGSDQVLPTKYQDRLRSSWGHVFRHEVFARIDERIFAVLYSEGASRPNAPVNVIVGAEILKAGFGWSDLELADQMTFNLQVRHALGLDDLAMEVPELRTIYNWRRRVREHAEATGTNLFQNVYTQVTDEQIEALELKTEWQRVDSTQMLSNLAKMSRLELVISLVQKLWRSLSEQERAPWEETARPYVARRPYQVCYGVKAGETHEHLHDLGHLLLAWAKREDLFDAKQRGLIERVLSEQYSVSVEGEKEFLRVRWDSEIGADSLQSPHDEEATYRIKGGKSYRGGYVAGVSETCDPENQLQLITDVQVAPNAADDAELLERSLESQAERGVKVEAVTTDGGYTGPVAEAACAQHGVEHRATRMRGGESRSGKLGWETYEWRFDEEGEPVAVRCPRGKEAPLKTGKGGRFIARFDRGACEGCPLLGGGCRVRQRARGTSFSLKRRTIEVAAHRQRLRPGDKPVRAAVEATIRSVKHVFPGGKLPVRGVARATMMICASAMMANLRRIHRYRQEHGLWDILTPIVRSLQRFCRRRAHLWPPFGATSASARTNTAMSCHNAH